MNARHAMVGWIFVDLMIVLMVGGVVSAAAISLALLDRRQKVVRAENVEQQLRIGELEQLAAESQQALWSERRRQSDDQRRIDEMEAQLRQAATIQAEQYRRERMARQELLAIGGDLSRTVFVIDCSGSMAFPLPTLTQQAAQGRADPTAQQAEELTRWTAVVDMVAVWLEHLPVERFQVICFASDVTVFPGHSSGSSWLDASTEHREQAIDFLRRHGVGGWTNTEAALELALSCEPTAVILFTDGAPNRGRGGNFDPEAARQVLQIATDRERIVPVNVIGVGDYFDTNLSGFMLDLARATGGGFLGLNQ